MARTRRTADVAPRPGPASTAPPAQRIDIFLWYARLAGSRSAAQALAQRGVVRLNGRRVERAHVPVRPGDLLTLPHGPHVRVIRVLQLPHRRGPAPEARLLYELIVPGGAPATDTASASIDIDAGPHGE